MPNAAYPPEEAGGQGTSPEKTPLLEQVRHAIRRRHLARRTEKAYLQWIRRFLRFHRDQAGQWRHPREMGSAEVNQFLTWLAVQRNVSASTQNQALSALVFLFRTVLDQPLTLDAARARRPSRLPVVLSVEEVRRILAQIPQGPRRLIAGLMYGAGLRLLEACRLRVKDLDFQRRQIVVRDGKGRKDRAVPLPQRLVQGLQRQTAHVGQRERTVNYISFRRFQADGVLLALTAFFVVAAALLAFALIAADVVDRPVAAGMGLKPAVGE